MMAQDAEMLVDQLVLAVPALREIWSEHQQAYADQAPHAFLRTLAFRVVTGYLSGDPARAAQARRVADYLETRFGADADSDGLISAAFLAHLPAPDGRQAGALDVLGPKLRAAVKVAAGSGRSSEAGLVDRLVRAVPALEPVLRDHLDFYDELLPHLFMGEVTPLVVEWAEPGEPDQQARARAVIEKLEAEYGHDYQVDELISASFVENLPRAEDPGGDVLTLLGPKLREVQQRMHGDR
ncbi:hypothetical protein SAMN05421678_12441 [Actinopolymorpha cephalotaxi]|uniref:DUF7674 domain-containing protein n=1 Tax=Actinopolymorpha cephalotaxi TaxID=504797 RepID=A0A1I3BHX0_9ACTN|nr:hypothetical protein [Actinopolymorpha cephalotaxi]NYH86391.1 hypothetical protein [Actinopolymorpha cephalotaxi]SFH61750.1 hypothetical protein SAMN05421678_12441 [Actinopolymorpha cephalotaxi]